MEKLISGPSRKILVQLAVQLIDENESEAWRERCQMNRTRNLPSRSRLWGLEQGGSTQTWRRDLERFTCGRKRHGCRGVAMGGHRGQSPLTKILAPGQCPPGKFFQNYLIVVIRVVNPIQSRRFSIADCCIFHRLDCRLDCFDFYRLDRNRFFRLFVFKISTYSQNLKCSIARQLNPMIYV